MLVLLAQGYLKTKFGVFLEKLYYDGQSEAIALVMGDVANSDKVLCRVHSHCISAHVFNSIECDCREQMEMAQAFIQQEGKGILIWLNQEGRGNGHLALLSSADLRAQGYSQTEAYKKLGYKKDARDYRRAAEILIELKVLSVVLLTNNPLKIKCLEQSGIKVVGSKRLIVDTTGNSELRKTYQDKINRGHLIDQKHIED